MTFDCVFLTSLLMHCGDYSLEFLAHFHLNDCLWIDSFLAQYPSFRPSYATPMSFSPLTLLMTNLSIIVIFKLKLLSPDSNFSKKKVHFTPPKYEHNLDLQLSSSWLFWQFSILFELFQPLNSDPLFLYVFLLRHHCFPIDCV